MSCLAIIPARAGSKGLPGKNLMTVAGRTLVERAVEVARAVQRIDDVIVSSDSRDVLHAGARAGARAARRPTELAEDQSTTIDVILHHLAEYPAATSVVLLQPTSPLRNAADVEACLDAVEAGAPSAATVTPAHPVEWSFHQDAEGRLVPVAGWPLPLRRQDALPAVALNGAVYVSTTASLRALGALVGPGTVGVLMPPERSVDIDGAFDLALARALADDDGGGTA